MLNITNLLKKKSIKRIFQKKGDTVRLHKRNLPFSKEWYNALYVFNRNPVRTFPAIHNYVFELLKEYFNMINEDFKMELNPREYKEIKNSLGNKIWISTPEIKHYNDKIIITIFTFNRLYNHLKKELNLSELTWGPKIKDKEYRPKKMPEKKITILRKVKYLKQKHPLYFVKKDHKSKNYKSKDYYINIIKWLKLEKYINLEQFKLEIIELIKLNKREFSEGLDLLNIERYDYLINQFKRELIYLELKQKILYNEFKFKELYLVPITKILQNIYNKKIEFNIIILKNYFLSSSILSQIIAAKITSIKNRGNPLRPIGNSMARVSTPNLSGRKLQKIDKTSIGMQNIILNEQENEHQDYLNKFLLNNSKKSSFWSSEYIDKLVLKNLDNKSIAGIFIKVAGRLTKRYKAQRAFNSLRHKGTLKNVYSAHKGFSSMLSRGYSNINVEKTVIHSKVRIGAFGITGWISSY